MIICLSHHALIAKHVSGRIADSPRYFVERLVVPSFFVCPGIIDSFRAVFEVLCNIQIDFFGGSIATALINGNSSVGIVNDPCSHANFLQTLFALRCRFHRVAIKTHIIEIERGIGPGKKRHVMILTIEELRLGIPNLDLCCLCPDGHGNEADYGH